MLTMQHTTGTHNVPNISHHYNFPRVSDYLLIKFNLPKLPCNFHFMRYFHVQYGTLHVHFIINCFAYISDQLASNKKNDLHDRQMFDTLQESSQFLLEIFIQVSSEETTCIFITKNLKNNSPLKNTMYSCSHSLRKKN